MNRKGFKLATYVMVASLLCTQLSPILANTNADFVDVSERAASTYEHDDYEFTKISHADKKVSTPKDPVVDGVIDYIGNGKVGAPYVDEGANGQGARGQSYAWASVAYGDYMYVSTLENAAGATIKFMGSSGLGHDYDPEIFNAILGVLYRGDFFIEEKDKVAAGSCLSKINVKTGEVTVLMSKEKNGLNTQFRNGLLYNDKMYFCGAVNFVPAIYEVDPKTDEFKMVYCDESMKNPNSWKEAMKKQISPTIRGMSVYKDYLVISCLGLDGNPYIAVSNDPSKGFTRIASSYQADGSDGELFGYPAFHFQDSIYGGSIWEMIEFNDDLYVAMCTGTPENSKDGGKSFQSFAIVRGRCNGAIDDPNAWTWTPIVGDKEKDNAKYTFGIDPERTRSGACSMMVYDDHLYVGEYNDIEIALVRLLFDLDTQFMADNLEQSVSLYRMDQNEDFELVAGNPTSMFKESITGLKSGFGKGKPTYENQYIWKMHEFQDKLYIGTFDQSSLTEPIAQFSNGDLLRLSKEEWQRQFQYIFEFLKLALKNVDKPTPEAYTAKVRGNEATAIANAAKKVKASDIKVLQELLSAQIEASDFLAENKDLTILNLPKSFGADDKITSLKEFHEKAMLLQQFLENNEDWTLDELIQSHEEFYNLYQKLYDYLQQADQLPDYIKSIYDQMINEQGLDKIKQLVRCLIYLSDSQRGFDMFEYTGGSSVKTITNNGLGDPFNHGLRAFATNEDPKNPWFCIGTANPFYGAQIWRLEQDGLNLPPVQSSKPNISKPEDAKPAPSKPNEAKPDKPATPQANMQNTNTSTPTQTITQGQSVNTGDYTNKALLVSAALVSLAMITFVVIKRKKQQQ